MHHDMSDHQTDNLRLSDIEERVYNLLGTLDRYIGEMRAAQLQARNLVWNGPQLKDRRYKAASLGVCKPFKVSLFVLYTIGRALARSRVCLVGAYRPNCHTLILSHLATG